MAYYRYDVIKYIGYNHTLRGVRDEGRQRGGYRNNMKLERHLNSFAEKLKSMHHKYKTVLPSVPVPFAFVVVPEPP